MTTTTDRWTELRDQLEAAATTLDRLADLIEDDEYCDGRVEAAAAIETALRAVAAELNRAPR